MKIILASASPRRKELLKKIVNNFKIIPSQIDENIPPEYSIVNAAIHIAREKALDISARYPDAIVIGADTVVALDEVMMGKPADLENAKKMLEALSGKTHQVVTGIAIFCADMDLRLVGYDFSEVTFRKLTREQIENYVNKKQPLDKAGSYGIQEIGHEFVEHLEGSYENVMGLPVDLVADMLGYFEL